MLKKGDIVTVIRKGYPYRGMQGQIVRTKIKKHADDERIIVAFPEYPGQEWAYRETNLRKDKGWSLENRVNLLFKRNSLFLSKARYPLRIGHTLCMHEKCGKKATQDILINCWGNVCQIYVCDDHSNWNGKCVDSFPFR